MIRALAYLEWRNAYNGLMQLRRSPLRFAIWIPYLLFIGSALVRRTFHSGTGGAALVIGLAFRLTLEGTRLGLAARAVIMNETLARGLGLDTTRVRLVTFMIGAGLAALAGVLLTPLTSVDPNTGVT